VRVTDILEQDKLAEIAERIRTSAGLGRSHTLHKLFDYLLERTLRGESPKEIEIATDIFGKSGSDLLTDASVRVYVHRLRKKLDDYYAGPGQDEEERLALPKGDYRFELVGRDMPPVEPEVETALPAVPVKARGYERWLFLGLGLLVGGAIALAVTLLNRPNDGLGEVRASPIWASLVNSTHPLTVVPGDYYILGERDHPEAQPDRLVRDFSVNSRAELDELLMNRPDLRSRYVDLNLFYLPVSTGYAMKAIMPVVTPGLSSAHPVTTVPSSKLNPALLKSGDIIYVGLLSGLGLLQNPVFANSRFGFAGSFDELIDTENGKIYVADPPQDSETARRNYAYIARLPGPNGNSILIVAGTRDPALLQAADIVTSPAALAQLGKVSKDSYFEALYAVDGVGDENLRGTLIAASPRNAKDMWNAMDDAGN